MTFTPTPPFSTPEPDLRDCSLPTTASRILARTQPVPVTKTHSKKRRRFKAREGDKMVPRNYEVTAWLAAYRAAAVIGLPWARNSGNGDGYEAVRSAIRDHGAEWIHSRWRDYCGTMQQIGVSVPLCTHPQLTFFHPDYALGYAVNLPLVWATEGRDIPVEQLVSLFLHNRESRAVVIREHLIHDPQLPLHSAPESYSGIVGTLVAEGATIREAYEFQRAARKLGRSNWFPVAEADNSPYTATSLQPLRVKNGRSGVPQMSASHVRKYLDDEGQQIEGEEIFWKRRDGTTAVVLPVGWDA